MFDHVDHVITREVLSQTSIDEDSICKALVFASDCLLADRSDMRISSNIWARRSIALQDAKFAWNEEGDVEGTIAALRRHWTC